MSNIRISPQAQEDMQEIGAYISEELKNPSAAKNVLRKIITQIRTLEQFPKSGATLSSIVNVDTAYRFLVSGSYMVFYRYGEKHVYIDRALYGRRDYLRILFGDLPDENE